MAVLSVLMVTATAVTGHVQHGGQEDPVDPVGTDGLEITSEGGGEPDPRRWETGGESGVLYRRATSHERDANGWPDPTWLVEMGDPLATARAGGPSFSFVLPLTDDEAEVIDVALSRTIPNRRFTEVHIGGPTIVKNVTLQEYRSTAPWQEEAAMLTVGNDSGLSGWVFVNRSGEPNRYAEMWGANPDWAFDHVPTEDRTTVLLQDVVLMAPFEYGESDVTGVQVQCPVECGVDGDGDGDGDPPPPECDDGVDNDSDGQEDYPEDSDCTDAADDDEGDGPVPFDFHLLGEVKWCNAVGDNWAPKSQSIGDNITAGFRGNEGQRADPRRSGNYCFFMDTYQDAVACDTGELTCFLESTGEDYTFNKANGTATVYRDKAWDYVEFFRGDPNLTVPKVHAALVIHDGLMSSAEEVDNCGAASLPNLGSGWDEASNGPLPTGDGVAATPTPQNTADCAGADRYTPTHEMGHIFNAFHGDATTVAASCSLGHSVMVPGTATRCNEFTNEHNAPEDGHDGGNEEHITHCVDDHSDLCPRSGTG